MRKQLSLLCLTVIFILFVFSLCHAQEIDWGGYLQTEDRLGISENSDNEFTWHEYRLDLKAEVKPDEKSRFYSELWLRSWGASSADNTSELTDKDEVSPWGLDLREAYVDLYGFLFSNMDIRVGRQRIAWGTGDKINPTDNLNPYDLENLWEFGNFLGSDGMSVSYYIGDFTFTGVFIPTFTPAVLPRGDYASALFPPMELPDGVTLGETSDTVTLPENNPRESSTYGIRIRTNILNYDFSLSYVRGRDYLPMAKKLTLTSESPGVLDISSELFYPERQVAGIDMAGAILDVGIWGEAAVFFSEKVEMVTDMSGLGLGTAESVVLDDKPYTKYVLGGDYTFTNNIYINGQYVHGLFHERGEDNLHNYFIAALEWKTSDEKIKIIPLCVILEIKDYNDFKNNYALIYPPEITYRPVDNAEITIGARWIDGKGETTFGQLKDNDEVYFKLKYCF